MFVFFCFFFCFFLKSNVSVCQYLYMHHEKMPVKCIPPHPPLLYSKNGVKRGIPIFLIFYPKRRLCVFVNVRTASSMRF